MEVPHKNELLHMVLKAETTEIRAVSPQEGSPSAFTCQLECLITKTSERVPDNHVHIFSSHFWFLLQQTKAILRMERLVCASAEPGEPRHKMAPLEPVRDAGEGTD
jgi:hypothetical protein